MISIEFPAPADLMNLNDRMHHMKRASLVMHWRKAAFVFGMQFKRQQPVELPLGPSIVKLTLPVKSTRTRRDPSNWTPTTKAVVDGLTDAGFWPDDNSDWVATLEPAFWTTPAVLVQITPRGES